MWRDKFTLLTAGFVLSLQIDVYIRLPETIDEAFRRGREPTRPCTLHEPYAPVATPAGDTHRGADEAPAGTP